MKEAEAKKLQQDKALWLQKYEMESALSAELRQELENQKLYYLQIIASLKLGSSPVKQPISMQTKINDSRVGTV